MKKFLLIAVVFLLGIRLNANPLPPLEICIAELIFDTPDKWRLEVRFTNIEYFNIDVSDVAFAINISGETLIGPAFSYFSHSGNLLTIHSDSFNFSKPLNPLGDTITIIPFQHDNSYIYDSIQGKYYFANMFDFFAPIEDNLMLIFGNCEGSVIQAPKIGQSIALCGGYYTDDRFYTIDNTPTIGSANDNDGIFGIMQGIVYDKDSLPVANRNFKLMGINFSTDENGTYSASIYAKRSIFTSIQYDYSPSQYQFVSIDEISFEIYPDSIIERDIYLLGDIPTSISDIKQEEKFPIRFFPNPVSASGKLHYETDLPILSGNMSLHVFSLDGKLLLSHKITDTSGDIKVPQTAGIYRITLKMDDKIIASKSIAVE